MASNNGTPVPSKLTTSRSIRLPQTPNPTPNNMTPDNTTPYYPRPANQNQTTTAPECVECGMICPNCAYPKIMVVKQQAKSCEPEQRKSEEPDKDEAFTKPSLPRQPEHEGAEQTNATDQTTGDFTSAPQQPEAKEEKPVDQLVNQKKTKSQRKRDRKRKNNEKKNAQQSEADASATRPDQDEIVQPDSVSNVQPETTTEIEDKDEGKVAEENKDAQTEDEKDKDDNSLRMREEDKKGEDEDEDEDDAKVEWSKYVSKRLYKMARTDPSSMTAAELEQFNEQGLKHQYDKHFTPHERTLWDDESLPRDLTLKLIHFRQRIERNAVDALETEDKDLHCDTQDFDRLRSFWAELHIDAYQLVAEELDREVKEREETQKAGEYGSAEEEYESADEEYPHPDEDDYRPPYTDRSRYLPAMGHGDPTSMQHSAFPPANYNGRSMYGEYDFFGQNSAPQVDWSGEVPRSGRRETTHNDWYGPPSPQEETTQW